MSRVSLALYRPHKWWDIGGRLIAWWSRSEFSHCELVVDGECYSSSIRDGGVRVKKIDVYSPHWAVIDLPWADPVRAVQHFLMTENDPYGWLDLIGSQIFNRGLQDDRRWFCSEWCATALGISRPELFSPGTLGDYCRMRK